MLSLIAEINQVRDGLAPTAQVLEYTPVFVLPRGRKKIMQNKDTTYQYIK